MSTMSVRKLNEDEPVPTRAEPAGAPLTTRSAPAKLRDLMRKDVTTVTSEESADDAWRHMRAVASDYAVVTDRSGAIIGVLSRHDLSGPAGGGHRRMGRSAGELMHRDVISVSPGMTIARAADCMRKYRVGCLPIIARHRLVGIVTTSEMLGLLAHPGGRAFMG